MDAMKDQVTDKIIFFDGHCGLCNGFVDFVIKHDHQNKFNFSPLQSEFAKKTLAPADVEDLKSIIVHINGQTYKKSQAVFAVTSELGGAWKWLSSLENLPSPLRNWGYDLIAKNRYRLFGRRDSCRLPTSDERKRFIL